MKSFFKNTYLAFIFIIIYTPIFVLMLFSFNGGDSIRRWSHWSLDGYRDLFNQTALWQSISVTLIVAFISTFVAVIIGTFAALGLSKTKKLTRNLTLGITNIPLVNADIVTAVSLMLLFMAFGFSFGLGTLIFAHISFNIPYVIITVLPKIRAINMAQLEASQDLGATPWYTLRKIVLPTIKPAIIAGAAIAFAMSFDDFLISYFTGGNTSNVSSFIYSLKRIKPYVNAFSTIIIIIIALIIVSWNSYVVIKKQLKHRNEKIAKGHYYDAKIIKTQKTLTKYYLQLNSYHLKKGKTRKGKAKTNIIFAVANDDDITQASNQITKNQKLIAQIEKLENKLKIESIWVQQIKTKIANKKKEKEERSKLRREKYRFLLWPWKMIMVSIIIGSSFIGLGALYIYNNMYDLSVAIWGEYLKPEVVHAFQNKYHVRVKETNFDDNESLYAKLYTTNYDIMVPSDYMVAKLASEDRLLPLKTNDGQLDPRLNFVPEDVINTTLYEKMDNYHFQAGGKKANLNDYSIPYFWGDVVLVINRHNNNAADLGINENEYDQTNWDVLQRAVAKNKSIILNDDMHNIFMMALADGHYKNLPGLNKNTGTPTPEDPYGQNGNMFKDNINAQDSQEITTVSNNFLKNIINYKETSLANDDIVDKIADPDKWDVAMMYNGDLLAAIGDDVSAFNDQYWVIRPYMGTNIWVDSMVISKNSSHQDLAFAFINYVMDPENQIILSTKYGYTSPIQAAMDKVSILNPEPIWKKTYLPGYNQANDPWHEAGHFNGLYTRDYDPDMQTAYNKLIAR